MTSEGNLNELHALQRLIWYAMKDAEKQKQETTQQLLIMATIQVGEEIKKLSNGNGSSTEEKPDC